MIRQLLEKRQGHEVHDEDTEAYLLGIKDALSAVLSDEVYFAVFSRDEVGHAGAITDAVLYVNGGWFKEEEL